MKKLSLCMIVKNEEKCLENCLKKSHDFANEIIIVDTGSTDQTKKIAEKYADKIFDFKWCGDFSKARNFAFDQATNDYIIWLDADDIILNDGIAALQKWEKSQFDCDVLMCPYVVQFDSGFKSQTEYYRERIVKNLPSLRWHDRVHEVIIPSGKICYDEKIKIYHNKKLNNRAEQNLKIYQQMIAENEKFSPRNQFYYARELYFNGYVKQAIEEFKKFIFLDDTWVENKIEAHLNLADCYCLEQKPELALSTLFASFKYDLPRGEIVYKIGNIYFEHKEYQKAVYWFKLAMSLSPQTIKGGFTNIDCYNFLPAIQLCVCCSRMGDDQTAYQYHLLTEKLKPDDERVKYNKKYFDMIKIKNDL